ncbi:hypothetical protein GC096_04200 [Paenibacillus sp. LMG 31461]|uniref:Butirosin biosynthesis protein H N-terminal domain-containing protein n=1 Tax=Paenibacillus plantarum TaxID=2654975 RepID=A0ABX1X5G0_9BACL|nr:BtrH N-terminal domain-containing protein [Paenibacillus plantarum]NOU63245.1 hypothetical protein [Paenibacillus plantarum]
MKKLLSIKMPFIYSYKEYALPLAIMSQSESCFPWILSNFLQLYIRMKYPTDVHWLDFYLVNRFFYHPNNPFLEIEKVRYSTVTNADRQNEFIINSIKCNKYVYLACDEYYLKHRSSYMKIHSWSQLLIYGYDMEKETYNILDYTNGKLSTITCSFSEIIIHTNSYVNIWLLEFNDANYDLDLNLVIQLLEDYIESYESFKRINFLPKPNYSSVFGQRIYDYLVEYYQSHYESDQNYYNILPLQILLEHKKCLHNLMNYIEDKNIHTFSSNLHKELTEVLNKATIIRNLYIKYLVDKKNRHLREVIANIQELRKLEYDVLLKFLRELKKIDLEIKSLLGQSVT